MGLSKSQLDRDIAAVLSRRRGRGSHATMKSGTPSFFAVEIAPSTFENPDLPTGAHWRLDLGDLAEQELGRGRRSYRRPANARYTVIEWTGMRGAVGRLLDWLEGTDGITRYAELFDVDE